MALHNISSANQGRVGGKWTDLFAQKRRELNSLQAEQDAVGRSVSVSTGGPPNPSHLKAFNSFEVRTPVSSQAEVVPQSAFAPKPVVRALVGSTQLSGCNPYDYEIGLQDSIEAVTASNVLAALRQARRLGRAGDAAYENGDMPAFGIAVGTADQWPESEPKSWTHRDEDSEGCESGENDKAEQADWEPPTSPTYRQVWEWQGLDEVDGDIPSPLLQPSGEDGSGRRRSSSEDVVLDDRHYPH
ncbi:hypothetical protein LTR17_009715 [Elasticomyces elasticus]|nr:hypothetical protein LTR17_009715 [Elasticomyces elasticus]